MGRSTTSTEVLSGNKIFESKTRYMVDGGVLNDPNPPLYATCVVIVIILIRYVQKNIGDMPQRV